MLDFKETNAILTTKGSYKILRRNQINEIKMQIQIYFYGLKPLLLLFLILFFKT